MILLIWPTCYGLVQCNCMLRGTCTLYTLFVVTSHVALLVPWIETWQLLALAALGEIFWGFRLWRGNGHDICVCVNMILTVLVLTVALVVVLALLWSNLLGGPTCKVGVPYTSALSIHRSVCLSIHPSVCHRTKHWPKWPINVAACDMRHIVTSRRCVVGPPTLWPLKGPAHLVHKNLGA